MIAHNLSTLTRTSDIKSTKTFSDLYLSDFILKSLKLNNFHQPTPIQTQTLPCLRKSNSNFIIHGKAGTGKTLVFAVAALEKFLRFGL